MVINISVQYNGGFLPDIILLTQGYLHRDIRLNIMKKLCICSRPSGLLVGKPHTCYSSAEVVSSILTKVGFVSILS